MPTTRGAMTHPPAEMPAAYAAVRFAVADIALSWPPAFAIITAWATTGERWSEARNRAADAALRAELFGRGLDARRITGYSPATGHAEPGWTAPIGFDAACDLGQRYLQDALYYVEGDALSVSYCDARRQRVSLGGFRSRLTLSEGTGA